MWNKKGKRIVASIIAIIMVLARVVPMAIEMLI